jgi:uncharacterized iron-regulated protein
MRRTLVMLLLAAGCSGSYRSAAPTARPADPGDAAEAEPPPIPVEQAGLPFAIVDARTGRAVSEPELYARLASARAICVGEEHPNPHHHWAQLTLVGEIAGHNQGRRLALGLEMVQAPFQGVLDDWTAQKIDEPALLQRTGWSDRWGYDFALYRPVLERARTSGMTIVALNAPRELVKAVAKKGVAGLSAEEKGKLPALVLDDAQHRAWFDGIMADVSGHASGGGHGGGDGESEGPPPGMPKPDDIYAAQVVWDESMAERARGWLAEGEGTMVILAGTGHCHDSAIVRRLVRRGGAPAVSIRPIVDDGEGNVARALAEAQNDFLFVMSPPPPPAKP